MENKEMTRRDFLKGIGIVATGALAAKLLNGKIYIPYVSDTLEEKDEYDAKGEIISFTDLSKFYLLEYKTPYEISGIGGVTSQHIKPNIVTFVEKEKDLYQKISMIVHQDDNVIRCIKEKGQRYTEEGIQRFYNNKEEIQRFVNFGDYIRQLGMEKDHYSAEEVYKISSSYQNWDLDYSSERETNRTR